MNDNRSKLQAKLERTRWQPFGYVSGNGTVFTDPPNSAFEQAAMMTTAIIAKMMFNAAKGGRRLNSPKS